MQGIIRKSILVLVLVSSFSIHTTLAKASIPQLEKAASFGPFLPFPIPLPMPPQIDPKGGGTNL